MPPERVIPLGNFGRETTPPKPGLLFTCAWSAQKQVGDDAGGQKGQTAV